ncbi:MAG: DUF3267 domain-containing protein [Anaerolineales bacterium]
MRILFDRLPPSADPAAGVDPGRPIRQPGRWVSAILAALAGLFLLAVPVSLSIAQSVLYRAGESNPPPDDHVIPWAGMVVVFVLCILAHELVHTLLHPDGGRSDSSVLIINWKKLQFGVYYEGCIPRRRWIAMRLLPLTLTALPLAGLLLFYSGMSFAVETYLIILILTNSLGSGGDLVAALIVLRQVPPGGVLNFHRGRAYWLTGSGESGG